MIMLEKCMGLNSFPALVCLAKYVVLKKMPLRIELMSATFTEAQCAGLLIFVA